MVNLELMDGENKVQHVVYGQDYILKAHFSQPDGKTIIFLPPRIFFGKSDGLKMHAKIFDCSVDCAINVSVPSRNMFPFESTNSS